MPDTILTAYDFNTARALEAAQLDYILVGDSLAMVGLGYKSTAELSLEEMIFCAKAVRRGAPKSKIIVDLPYCSAIKDLVIAKQEAIKLIHDSKADLIKIENTKEVTLDLIKALLDSNIEVMGHIGYTPQTDSEFQAGRVVRDESKHIAEAQVLQDLGVKSIVLELVPQEVAAKITALGMYTVGIGSGTAVSAQVLVTDDLLGRFNLFKPKFVERYAKQYENALEAINRFKNDVSSGAYPDNSKHAWKL